MQPVSFKTPVKFSLYDLKARDFNKVGFQVGNSDIAQINRVSIGPGSDRTLTGITCLYINWLPGNVSGAERTRALLRYLVRPVLFVNVQNVDPQSVPLLERSVAEVAGELPVALVHAARVLQVLVSVVLVREHLPAPVALEPVAGIWGRNVDTTVLCLVKFSREKNPQGEFGAGF